MRDRAGSTRRSTRHSEVTLATSCSQHGRHWRNTRISSAGISAEARTTVGGRQHIDAVPLESSQIGGAEVVSDLVALFETDYGPPVRLLDLATLRGQPDALRRLLHDDSKGILVADAETDDDLMTLASAVDGGRLRLCGRPGLPANWPLRSH